VRCVVVLNPDTTVCVLTTDTIICFLQLEFTIIFKSNSIQQFLIYGLG
jgi:hypothetical protein